MKPVCVTAIFPIEALDPVTKAASTLDSRWLQNVPALPTKEGLPCAILCAEYCATCKSVAQLEVKRSDG